MRRNNKHSSCERRKNKAVDLSTTWCEQDWIMLDLVILTKSTKLSRYIETSWTTQFWWRKTCMSWEAHVDGTHGGEEHLRYMKKRRRKFFSTLQLLEEKKHFEGGGL